MGWWALYFSLMILTMGLVAYATKSVWLTAIVGSVVSTIFLFALLIGLIP